MICLDDTDTLEGGASTDAVVDFTVHGLVGSTFTQLAAGQLSDTDPSVLLTAGTATSIVSVIFVNTHSSAVTVNLYLDPANGGNPRRMIPKDVSLGIGYSLHFDGQRISIMDTTGGIAYSYIAHTHDGDTLALDGINSNGGAFPFTTTGAVSHNQDVITTEDVKIGDGKFIGSASDPDAIAIAGDGNLTFSGQSGMAVAISDDDDIPDGGSELVQFDTEEFDTQNEHNSGTYATTISDNGKYQVSIVIRFEEAIADGKFVDVYLRKNAATYTTVRQGMGLALAAGICLSAAMELSANDVLNVYVYHNHTEARQLDASNCRFSVVRIA